MAAPLLTGRERKALRALAHHLEPVVHVGSAGITDAVTRQVDGALRAHEFVKVRLHQPVAKHDAAAALAAAAGAALCGVVGHVVILYRPDPERPKIIVAKH